MKCFFTPPKLAFASFLVLLLIEKGHSQTFNGQGNLLIPPGAPAQTVGITESIAMVSGVGILGGCVQINNVTINATHSFTGDVCVFLIGPGGQVIDLTTNNGGGGDNWTNTVFKDNAVNFPPAPGGAPPYTGNFRPEGRQASLLPVPAQNFNPLGTFTFANTYNGTNADGDWKLHFNDHVAIDVGLLISWSITFTVGGTLMVTASPDVSICAPQSTTLSAVSTPSGATFSWSNGAGSGASVSVSPTSTTIFTVTATLGTCTATDQVEVTVTPGIMVDAGTDQTTCSGQSATFTAIGPSGATYSWSNGETGPTITVMPVSTTTYTVTASENGCSGTDQVSVIISPSATATLTVDNSSICAGQTVTVIISMPFGNGPFDVIFNENGVPIVFTNISTVGGTLSIPFVLNTTTVFELISVIDVNGCALQITPPASATVTVSAAPTPIITGVLGICRGQSTTLAASGGSNFLWSNGQTMPSIAVSPVATTDFVVTVSNGGGGCSATATAQVEVTTLNLAVLPTNPSICPGQTVILEAIGPSSAAVFLWSTGETTASISVLPAATTVFSVTVTDGPCQSTASTTVSVDAPTASAGPDQVICSGQNATLTASGGSIFLWSNGQNTASILVAPNATTTFSVTVSNAAGCSATDDADVLVNALPAISAGPDQSICVGSTTTLTASGIGNFVWSNGQNGSSTTVSPTFPTTFLVTLTDANGCSATDDVFVDVGLLIASITPNQSICTGENMTLSAGGGPNFLWSNGATTASISVAPTSTTVFSVTVSDPSGCSDDANTTITVSPLPTANAGPNKTICIGQNTTLTASGGSIFSWSNGATTASTTVSPASNTTFFVTVSNAAGCSATDDIDVLVNAAPTVSTGLDQNICGGQNAVLTAAGVGTFLWSNGQNTPSITVNPTVSTTFSVTLTDSNGCTATDQVAVNVSSVNATVSPNQTICTGQSATISAAGGTNFLWSNGDLNPSIFVSPTATTVFSVTVSDASGCSDVAVSTVSIAPVPIANAGPDKTICVGENVVLTASGGSIFQWSNGQNAATTTVSPAATTTFSVTVFNGSCSDSDDATVIVNLAPSLTLSPDATICEGENTDLQAVGAGTFLWSTGETTAAITVAPTSTTSFFVTLTDAAGCKTVDFVAVNVQQQPTANAGSDQQLCAGNSAILTATGGATFLWSNGQTGQSIIVSPTSNSTFSVTVSNGNCAATDAVLVNVQPQPTVAVNPIFNEICEGQTAILTATGSAGSTFQWSTGQFSPSITVSPTATTTFDVTATSNFGCQNFASATVEVTPANGSAGNDATICAGQTGVLTASGGTTFSWSNGQNTASISVAPTVTTTFDVTITNGNCIIEDAATVFVNPLPTANAGPNQAILTGQTAVLIASGGGNYAWSNGATTASSSVSPTITTTFSVTVTTAGGCTSTDEMTVFVDQPIQVNLGPDQTICLGQNATLTAAGTVPTGTTILWSNGATTPAITVSPAATSAFSVTISSASGQNSSDEMMVFVNQTPIAPAQILGPAAVCKNADGTFSVDPVTGATSYFWQIPTGATLVSGQNTTQIEVDFSQNTASGSISVVAENACGQSPTTTFSIQINEPPAALGPLAGDLAPCASAATSFSIPMLSAGSSLFWTVSGGGFLTSGQGSPTVSVDWNGSAGGQLCAVAENGCGLSPSLCSTFSTTPAPVADAGPDVAICFQNGAVFSLNASAIGAGSGSWSGSTELTFSNQNAPDSDVSASKSGIFEATWTVSSNGCVDVDTLKITFSAPPTVSSVVEKCNSSATDFTVEIALAGGQSPYFLNGQPFAQPFISQPFLSGENYAFSFADARGCIVAAAGTKTCNCATQVGAVDLAPILVCEGDDFAVLYNMTGQTLDPDDVLTFFLFENTWPTGPILAASASPTFAWQPVFSGKNLFAAAVVGSNNGSGQPILTEGCTDVSQPVAVDFHILPTVGLMPSSGSVCTGGCDSLELSFVGNGPFDLVFTENGIQKELKNLAAQHFEKICPTASTVFSLVSVSDFFCENAAAGQFSLTVNQPVSVTVAPSDQVCNSTASGFSTTRDFKNYVLSGDATGVWVDLDDSGAAGVLPNLDFENVAAGVYRFEYTTAAALAPCPQMSSVLQIEVTANCVCPTISVAQPSPICDDLAVGFDLAALVSPSSGAGFWSILSQPNGANPSLLGSVFPTQNAAAGVYQLAFTLAVAPSGICEKADTTTLEIFEKMEAGQPFGSPLVLCQNAFSASSIDLFSLLENEETGGAWVENSTVLSQNGAFSAQNGRFDPKTQAVGSYRFRYYFAQNGPCPADFSEIEIVINPAPTASAGADQTVSCQNPTVEIGLFSGQPNVVFEWKNAVGQIISTAEKTTVGDAGFYFLEVKNAAGCTARDTVEIKNDGSKPTAAIASSTPFLTCKFLSATLDAAASLPVGGLSFEWFLNQNLISTASKIDSAAAAGIYQLVVTNTANGCTDEQLFDLKIDNVAPVLAFLTIEKLSCAKPKIALEVQISNGGGGTFSFSWQGPQIVGATNLAKVEVEKVGFYAVTVTNAATGCTAAASGKVEAELNFVAANAGPDLTLSCRFPTQKIGQQTGQNFQFLWSNGATTEQIEVSSGGLFVLTVTNAGGCTAVDSVLVSEDFEKPVAKILPTATVLTCATDEILLDGSGSTSSDPLIFEWFLGQNSLSTGLDITVSAAGCYRLEIKSVANGCRDTAEICILENKKLPVAVASASNDLTCKFPSATLSVVGSNANGAVFLAIWTGPNGFVSDLFSPTIFEAGDYFLTIMNSENGCTSTASMTVGAVGQVAFPFEILTKNPTCAGDCDGSIRLQNPSLAGLEVAFETGDFESKTNFSSLCSGIFDLKVRDLNGCEWSEKRELLEPEKVAVALGADVFLTLGDSVEIAATTSATAVLLQWSPVGLTCFDDTFCQQFWARPFENQLFKITAFDANGCTATDDILIHVARSVDVFAPNIFAPESAENGRFSIFFGRGVIRIEAFQIFDRWGERVFEQLDFEPNEAQNGGWDGRFRGEKTRPGVFVWFCKFELADGRRQFLKGDLTVIR